MHHLSAIKAISIFVVGIVCSSLLRIPRVEACERVIPLSPSTTEVVFDLGLGDRVIATSSYTTYPGEALHLPRVGGLLDPNIEQMLLLKPTLIILLNSQASLKHFFEHSGIQTLTVDHNSLDGLRESYQLIGQHCGVEDQSTSALQRLDTKLNLVKRRYPLIPDTRVLLVVGSLSRAGDFSSLYLSGNDGIYTSLLEYLGAKNVIVSKTSTFGSISPETMLILNPDFVIHIAPQGTNIAQQNTYWRSQEAILHERQQPQLLVLDNDYASIPGPRLPLLLRDIAQFLSPSELSR